MKKLPPEIDQLMWAVAENPNPQAVVEFEVRHPEFRLELLKRVEMVRGLRQEAKGPRFQSREIPKFEPRPLPPQGIPRGSLVAGLLALAALSFAAFTVVHSLRPTKPKPIPQQEFAPLTLPNPPVVYNSGPQSSPTLPQMPPPPPVEPPKRPDNLSVTVPLDEKRRDLKLSDVNLVSALSLITSGTNIHLEIGPGFVNQKVTLAFVGKTTREMLTQMAKDYAFTVSDEGDDKYLVLPVPDTGIESHPEEQKSLPSQRRVGP